MTKYPYGLTLQAVCDAIDAYREQEDVLPEAGMIEAFEILLAAMDKPDLTAQPVAWLVEFHEPVTDDYCREVKVVQLEKPEGHYRACATPLIRVAGYEVQE